MTNGRNFGSNNDLMYELENLGRYDVDVTEGDGAAVHEKDLDNFHGKYGGDETGLTPGKEVYTLADDDTMAELTDLGEAAKDMRAVSAEYQHRETGINGLLDEEPAEEPAQTESEIDIIR